MSFQLKAPYQPAGDQPKAIQQLVESIQQGNPHQTLLGVTGSGKTFTLANVIAQLNRPTLVISHNKTLAEQLHREFKQFFPNNAVEYFVSYYDYYQPEAYVPTKNLYIEKDLSINSQLDQLRLRSIAALLSNRSDVIVVASVSCIYGLSDPATYGKNLLHLRTNQAIGYEKLLHMLVKMHYHRKDDQLQRGTFRVKGDTIHICPAHSDQVYRLTFWDDTLEAITQIDPDTGYTLTTTQQLTIFPANLFVTDQSTLPKVMDQIRAELQDHILHLNQIGQHEQAARVKTRTLADLEMMAEIGYCSGIENYSRHFDGRKAGERPYCLLDYFPKDSLTVIDESHVTLPQIRAMYSGDRIRKQNLIDYGFRLPSALDNRPLQFQEFEQNVGTTIYVSATPGPYELQQTQGAVISQIIRPTGLPDPTISVRPTTHQIDDLIAVIHQATDQKNRVLITTLTKKMAEHLATYLTKAGIRCRYLHSEIKTLDRVTIIQGLRKGEFDVLIGVNLLREGLDLPEVSHVAILDADKTGFLRNTTSLIQTIGRAARNEKGQVILYGDTITPAMQEAIDETQRRRQLQLAHNAKHGIIPRRATRGRASHTTTQTLTDYINPTPTALQAGDTPATYTTQASLEKAIQQTQKQMQKAAKSHQFQEAIKWRTLLYALQEKLEKWSDATIS